MSQSYDLGVYYFLRHAYPESLRSFRQAIREDPSNATAWSYYGVCLAHVGQAAEAEAALARAVALGPENSEAWFHLGVARSLREEWSEAVSAYRRAVALAPNDLVAWHRLGVALAEAGDETSAAAAFERSLVLSEETPTARAPASGGPPLRDDHVEERGEREGAREAKSWLELALSLLSLGEEDEAVAAYERAYTLDPERARQSLFRPMLKLLTVVQGGPEAPDRRVFPGPPSPVDRAPRRPERRTEVG